jgi:hypothetical protein
MLYIFKLYTRIKQNSGNVFLKKTVQKKKLYLGNYNATTILKRAHSTPKPLNYEKDYLS